jgi:hypothetical protein
MLQQIIAIVVVLLLQASQSYSITVTPGTVVVSRTRGEWGVVLCIVDDMSQAFVCWDTWVPGHVAVGAGWVSEQGMKGNCQYNMSLSCTNQTLMDGTSFESIEDLASADDMNITYEGMAFRFILHFLSNAPLPHHNHSLPSAPGQTAGV